MIALLSVITVIAACQPKGLTIDTDSPTELATELDSVSYLLGMQYAKGLKEQGGVDEIDNKSFIIAVQRVLEGKENEISEDVAKECMTSFFAAIEAKKSEAQKATQDSFFSENKTKEGIIVSKSGLQYRILKEGTGAVPKTGEKVKVHYNGKLLDGTIFDSSIERGEPMIRETNRLIPGFTEALEMMPIGSKWELFIPYELGYGERGTGPIPPYASLIFEVELLDIVTED